MYCLQLMVPPLPVLLTVGHSTWPAGQQHLSRSFPVYDMIIVARGALYMTEDGQPYEIKAGMLLLLEPGRTHIGHLPCKEPTEIYWVHFRHDAAVDKVDPRHIPWSSVLRQGTDFDQAPEEQYMYLPKFAAVDLKSLQPVLDDMVQLRSTLCHENAVLLHAMLGRLLGLLHLGLRSRQSSRSFAICEQVKAYIRSRSSEPFRADELAAQLHFDFDYAARCLKKHTGMSPLQYQHFVRMEEAKRLLQHTVQPVQDIADAVGFTSYNYFIRMFRKTVGVTPVAYRNIYRGLV